MKTKLHSIIFLLMVTSLSWAQGGRTINGTVTDDAGGPLPGVNVLVRGTTTGTQTDFDGNYSLEVSPGSALEFSYLGFQTQEIVVADQTEINVNMVTSASDLDEVVVVGYGNQKRSDITGAVVSIKADEIAKQPAVTALQSIQGKVAGVNIIASDAPGSSPTVLVRGLGTALGGRSPFYVVDGQPVSDIRSINPNDIASIDFLKGASYANIYGIRAANGVILITTKKGKPGKAEFRFDSYYGARTILNRVDMANGRQYAQYFNEEGDGLNNSYKLQLDQPYDTDWYDELLQTGFINNNSFSVSGAGENINYFLSYNLFQEEGVLKDATYTRGTIRNNNTYELFDNRLRIIQNLNITYTNESPKPFGAFNSAFRQAPIVPTRYPSNGRFGRNFVNETTGLIGFQAGSEETIRTLNNVGNPLADVFFADEQINTTTLQGLVTAEFDITDYLMATTRFGATKGYSKNKKYSDILQIWLNADPRRTVEQFEAGRVPDEEGNVSIEFANNSLKIRDEEDYRWNVDAFLTFTKSFGKHNLSATVGATRENFGGGDFLEAQAYDIQGERRLRSLDSRGGLFDVSANQDTDQSTNIQSYFARAEYDFDKKYYLRGVVRRDGTSNFIQGGNNFFDYFPAVSAGWTISNEDFLEDSSLVSNLKIFTGWGKLGNANVPLNVQQVNSGSGSTNTNYVFGPSQNLNIGAAFGSPALPISWEVTEEFEAGFDFGLLDQKLSGTFTYYNRLNTNTIIQVQNILNSSSEGAFLAQAAEVSNTGVEALVNWRDNIGDDFSYSVGANFSSNKNEVQHVTPGFDGQLGGNVDYGGRTKRLQNGEPIFAWWLYEAVGVWQTQEEIDAAGAKLGSPKPGYLRYRDQNEDGVIDQRDRGYFGSYIPTFNYGVNLSFNYKNLDFSVDGFGVGGNKVYNALNSARNGGENIPEEVFNNRWTGPGSTNLNPGAQKDREPSTYYLENGDYFRVNNVTLGYSLNDIPFFNKTRFYLTVQNPFIITNYSGFTPELNGSGVPNEGAGIELAAYPTNRTFILGANFQL